MKHVSLFVERFSLSQKILDFGVMGVDFFVASKKYLKLFDVLYQPFFFL